MKTYKSLCVMQKGITVLLINLDNSTTIETKVAFNGTMRKHRHRFHSHRPKLIRFPRREHKTSETTRYEYHLTAEDGNLHSQTMLLNGKKLSLNSTGNIPPLEPIRVNSSEPITVRPYSIVFVHIPYVVLPACR